MATQIMNRSERRVEKRKTLILLVFFLGVALASFALGVMVGRTGGGNKGTETPAPERLPVTTAPAPVVEEKEDPPPADGEMAPAADDLTFFDALPKGEQPPLGSGINLPPAPPQSPESSAATPVQPPRAQASPPPPPAQSPPAAPSAASSPAPPQKTVAAQKSAGAPGAFVIQVASFQDSADARKLQGQLSGRGYAAYTEAADLGSKGTWHRVMVGPFATDQQASSAADRLKSEGKLSTLVRRR